MNHIRVAFKTLWDGMVSHELLSILFIEMHLQSALVLNSAGKAVV